MSKKFLLLLFATTVALLLSSCVLVKDNTKPIISNFTKSATLLSQHLIYFKANVIDTGSGIEKVVFEINNSPLPTTKEGSSLFVSNWMGVYGSYSVTVLAQDRAGNLATKTDKFFVMDSTPPIVDVKSPLKVAKGMEFPISVRAYDLQSGIKNISMEIDGESVPVSKNEILEWTFSNEGIHELSVTAVNNQGLTKTYRTDINVINERKVPPYVQMVNFPKIIQSDKEATFSVYTYSPNGVKGVQLQIGKVTSTLYSSSKENTYTFHLSVHSSKDALMKATCTIYDSIGIKRIIHSDVMVLSDASTEAVIFPFSSKLDVSQNTKIPFFVGGTNLKSLKVSAYIDGIPVDVEGSFPKMFAIWKGAPGPHLLAVSLNGKIIKEIEFYSVLSTSAKKSPLTSNPSKR